MVPPFTDEDIAEIQRITAQAVVPVVQQELAARAPINDIPRCNPQFPHDNMSYRRAEGYFCPCGMHYMKGPGGTLVAV